MPRRTLQDALNTRIPEAVNLPPSDYRVIQYINLAQEKLLKRGHWWGTMGRFMIQANSGLITMPQEIASIERVAVCGEITPVHDFWYEWLDNGWGPVDETAPDCRATCEFRGNYPLFSDIVPGDKMLTLVCDLAADVGKFAVIQGYDDNIPPNWLRSVQDPVNNPNVYSNGMLLGMGQGNGVQGDFFIGQVTDITLPDDMQGQCWLYEVDTSTGANTLRLVGQYNASNPRPSFARYFFPSILGLTNNPTQVEILAKLEFIPVQDPGDYLMIGNLPALKLACMAIKAEEELRLSDASLLMNGGVNTKTGLQVMGAINELNFELDHYLGTGRKVGMNVQGFNFGTVEPVPNIL